MTIVYTVQPEHRYHQLRREQRLNGSLSHAMFAESYQWMMDQMEARGMGCAPDTTPIWLWERRPNRNEEALMTKGKRGVILTLEIPETSILWSSFDEWHTVLYDSPITDSDEEWDAFEKAGFPPEKVRDTWPLIFDASRWKPGDWKQGVTPFITMGHVKKVTRFIGKG